MALPLRPHSLAQILAANHDRLNIPRLASAEHIARRVLQLMEAIRRNPRSPDFEGLHPYLHHMDNFTSGAKIPHFVVQSKYVTEVQKTDAFILKQSRLMREEQEQDEKRRKPKKGGKQEEA